MANFHCHFRQCKFILSITRVSGEFILSCVIHQLYSKIETNYLEVFTLIFGGLDSNECTLVQHSTLVGILTSVLLKSHAGMMYSIQIKSLKCSVFKNLNIFFSCLNLVSYFSNALNNLTAFGLNKNLYDMFSPLSFEMLLSKLMSVQMNKGVPCDQQCVQF